MKKLFSSPILRYGLPLALFAALFCIVDFETLVGAFSNVTWEPIGILLLLSGLLIYVSALKWQLFITALGTPISALRLFGFYMTGYFVNTFMPSYFAGDALRSWYVGKQIGQHESFAATILERYTGFVAMVLLSLFFVWRVAFVNFEIKLAVVVIAVCLLVGTLISLSEKILPLVPNVGGIRGHTEKLQKAFHLVRGDKKLLVKALALSFLFHIFAVVNVVIAGYAVGWSSPPLEGIFVVLPLILLIGAVPISPSGLGIQEGAYVYFLTGVGATPEQALGVALVLRAKSYFLALLGGVVWLRVRKQIPLAT